MTIGRIHSIETMGLLDGPGIRTIFFLQGCPLKCAYCHNPDSQAYHGGEVMTPEDVLQMAKRYKPYYTRTNGGVTFSGGEPLMQGKFLVDSLKVLKAAGIHTTLDTSGFGQSEYFDEILELVDCVLLDIKAVNADQHLNLIGAPLHGRDLFMKALQDFEGKLWIRHVMVPGWTDHEMAMDALFNSVRDYSEVIEKIEILPYHKIGVEKYSQLGLVDPLEGTAEMDKAIAKEFEQGLMNRLARVKQGVPKVQTQKQKQKVS